MAHRFYFAYGSNMNQSQMSKRCPGAVCLGTAMLSGYKFTINERGVATVVPGQSSHVYGVLWRINDADEDTLDDYEGVPWRTYSKKTVLVERDTGATQKALIYVASNRTPGKPRKGYLEGIINAAKEHSLPSKYIKELASWSKTAD